MTSMDMHELHGGIQRSGDEMDFSESYSLSYQNLSLWLPMNTCKALGSALEYPGNYVKSHNFFIECDLRASFNTWHRDFLILYHVCLTSHLTKHANCSTQCICIKCTF